jgi:hypothetical protein
MRRGKAEESTNLPVFLFLLVLIGTGLVGGWFVFFGPSPDGRVVAVETLADLLTLCAQKTALLDTPDAWPRVCGLDATRIRTHFGFQLCFHGERCAEEVGIVREGSNFQACAIQGYLTTKDAPVCTSRVVVVAGKQYTLLVYARASLLEGTL